ncbi:hypothetical protein P0Y35_12870 [Kiritimatiellaeota bacterium B1221]|nr:hypothetical protein [Kiritimatiellaeota bacterium B1221]
MDFLKKHGEKVLFILLLAGLVASVLLAMNAKSNLQSGVNRSPNGGAVEMTMDLETLQGYIAHLSGESTRMDIITNAFTPSVRVVCMNPDDNTLISPDAKICPYCGWEQKDRTNELDTDQDGIPDYKELAWGMNPNDPNDVLLDQDNDGFNTLTEYQAGFDPMDPNSHLPLIDFVRLGEVVESSIEFDLRGIAKLGDKHTMQLHWKYPNEERGHTEYIKEGARFGRNQEFIFESYTPKRTLKNGKYVDESKGLIRMGGRQLEIYREGSGSKGKITESTATLMLVQGPEWEQEVKVNDTIELDKKSYIIVDINRQTVVLKSDVADTDSPESIKIQKPTPEELDALKPVEPEMNPNFIEEGMPLDMQGIF